MRTRADAYRKWQTLSKMTVARGCTVAEAATAKRLAASLAARWGFAAPRSERGPDPTYEARYQRAEQRAARHFRWEYRTCGKERCRCNHGSKHGPYKYAKRRHGAKVVSVYLGR